MSILAKEPKMGRKKTAAASERNETTVRIDIELATIVRMVASGRGISVAEYLNGILDPIVRADLEKESAKRIKPRSK